jgi:type II secretory pathway component PulL
VYGETEGVPDVPGTLWLLLEGSCVYARRPGRPPFALEGMTLRQTVDALGTAGADDEIKHAIAYADPGSQARLQAELRELADLFESAQAKVAVDGVFPHLAATLAQRPGTNLLQGLYAPKSNWIELTRPWRHAAVLLAAVGLLALVLSVAEYWALRRADERLGDLLTQSCQRIFGTNRASACDAELDRLRKNASAANAETFLTTLEAIAAARDPELKIDSLVWRNRTMDLQLIGADVGALDKFAKSLEQTHRFKPKIESANQNDTGVEGRMRIAPP